MANKRMFSMDVVDTDLFLEMPPSSQALYFHLGMRADDDGIVSSPKKIAKMTNCGEDDLRILATKGYIIPFGSGVIVITHWNINNNKIKGDRYKTTIYQKEIEELVLDNGIYSAKREKAISNSIQSGDIMEPNWNQSGDIMEPNWNQSGDIMEPQNRIDKNRVDKSNNYSVCFESFWDAYPRKKEKAKAYKCYKARLNDGYSEDELLTAAIAYAKECKERRVEDRYIKLGATFLGANTPFIDFLRKESRDNEEFENRGSAADYYRKYMS